MTAIRPRPDEVPRQGSLRVMNGVDDQDALYGFATNTPWSGTSSWAKRWRREVSTRRISGQFSVTRSAKVTPHIEPGMSTSVNTTPMSERCCRIAQASSAWCASTTAKPASSSISAAFIRTRSSSSTTRMTDASGARFRDMAHQQARDGWVADDGRVREMVADKRSTIRSGHVAQSVQPFQKPGRHR